MGFLPKNVRIFSLTALVCLLLTACGNTHDGKASELTVGAAANLTDVLGEIRSAFAKETGIRAVASYASTTQLTQQIRNSAPFDVFLSADTEHVDELVRAGRIIPGTRMVYARGVLALWMPKDAGAKAVNSVGDLALPSVRTVAVASPNAAPYGKAAVEALRRTSIWKSVEPKVVYSSNISMAKQFAASGNADAAFTAYSLVFRESGKVLRVDESLHSPLDQAAGVLAASKKQDAAARFLQFLTGENGRRILRAYGYAIPNSR